MRKQAERALLSIIKLWDVCCDKFNLSRVW